MMLSRSPGSIVHHPAVTSRPGVSHLLALGGYLCLTALLTWPAVFHLADAIPGDGFDGWQNYWNLWWVRQALLVERASPFFTDYLYAPTGVSLLFHTLNIFNGLWTLPLQLNFGLAIAYNSVVFFSFGLAGYGGYLLSLHILTRLGWPVGPGLRPAAFVGGLIFTMSPFHLAHLLGHMQVFSMAWPPFYTLWLLRTLDRPVRPRDLALTSLFLILASLVDWYHTLYLLIFTGLAVAWTGLSRRTWRPLGVALAIGLGFAVPLSPLLGPMMRDASQRPDLHMGLEQSTLLSADLLAFITPSEMHPLWGDWARSLAAHFSSTTSERLIFAGFVPLGLACFIIVRHRSSPAVRFWGLVTAVFGFMALGPYLHINGQIVTLAGWPLPLPYLLLYYTIPFIGLTRSLSRYDLMVMLGLGVLAAIATYYLTNGHKQSTKGQPGKHTFWPYLLGGLICFEFLAAPYPISKIEIPAFYKAIAAEPGDYIVAELPMNWDRPTPLLHQTVHGKRLLTAYTSRNNPLELVWRTPVLQQWRYLAADIIDQPLAEIAPTIFYDFNLRYIILDYWQMPPGPERDGTEQWLAAALPVARPVYDDGRLKVYASPPRESIRPYLSLGNGWSDRQERRPGEPVRTLEAEAELFLHHPPARPLVLELSLAAERGPVNLTVMANDTPLGPFPVGPGFTRVPVVVPAQVGDLVKLRLRLDGPAGTVTVSRIGLSLDEKQ